MEHADLGHVLFFPLLFIFILFCNHEDVNIKAVFISSIQFHSTLFVHHYSHFPDTQSMTLK